MTVTPHEPTNPTPPVPTPPVTPPAPPANEQPRFSQADLDRMLQRERETAGRQASRTFLERTGFQSMEQAEEALKAAETARQAALTEQQRATEAAQAAQRQAEERQAQAATSALQSAVQFQLVAQGMPALGPDGKTNPRLAMAARLVDVQAGADAAAVAAAVEQVRTSEPAWFLPAQATPSVNPGRAPGAPAPTNSVEEMMAAARQFHGTPPVTAS